MPCPGTPRWSGRGRWTLWRGPGGGGHVHEVESCAAGAGEAMEWVVLPAKALRAGMRDMVRFCDGRMRAPRTARSCRT